MVNYDAFQRQEPRTEKPERFYEPVQNIEKQTHRIMSIETRLTEENLAKCDLQFQSPLFRLPAELRSTIFEYVCHFCEDDEYRYREGSGGIPFYRPEHQARHITYTALLLTCRRAWLEANHLPLQLGDHAFWFKDTKFEHVRPSYLEGIDADEENRLENFLNGLTINNRQNLKMIHLYAKIVWLEEYSGSKCVQALNIAGVCPETLTITIRASDWHGWEIFASPPRIDDRWVENILKWPALPRLREIRLELEAGKRKKKGLDEQAVLELERVEVNLRRKFAVVKRVDHFGTPVSLVLEGGEEASLGRTWDGWALTPGEGGMRGGTMPATFTIKTLVWKVIADEEVTASSVSTEQETDTSGSTLNDEHKLPILGVSRSYDGENNPCVSPGDRNMISKFEQHWHERGSLLKFAPGLYATEHDI